jgi:hypothetical protein
MRSDAIKTTRFAGKKTENAALSASDIDSCGATTIEHPEMKRTLHAIRTAIVPALSSSKFITLHS